MDSQTALNRKVFISYSHLDEDWKNRLMKHLNVASRHGDFEIWHDRRLFTGDRWYEEIGRGIDESCLAVLLISSNFLDSDFILNEEVPRLLEAHQTRSMRFYPILISDCSWKRLPWLADFQLRLLDGKPLDTAAEKRQESELVQISEEIWDLVKKVSQELSLRLRSFLQVFRQRLEPAFSRWDLGNVGVTQSGGAGRPIEARLDDMYLPLRLADGFDLSRTERGRQIPPEGLVQRTSHLVIRGPAGAGKTTWMRWTFRQLLRMDAAFPMMIVLRDIAREWKDRSRPQAERALDAFLEGWIAQHVGPGWGGTLGELLSSMQAPRPVLLVDGWDELGPLGEELRSKLLGFLRQHPQILAVVTSRPYGEGRPSHHEGFEILDIQPISDSEIQDLSARFFAICHSQDTAAVQKDIEHFVRALERSSEAKALARTALLLTMMLLISRSQPLPDKRHLLYEECIKNLLTALPDRRQEEGVLTLREQWRPEDSEERMRVVAALAASLQEAGYSGAGRLPIVRSWDEMVEILPSDWTHDRRLGFLAWLAGPAGLLTDRADGTLAFAHLSFQEYLTAWQLNATAEGKDERTKVFLEHVNNFNWWETLTLWTALIERQNRERLDSVLEFLIEHGHRSLAFVGTVLADGLGTEARFQHWLSKFLEELGSVWLEGADFCARAWSASRQENRKEQGARAFSEKAPLRGWLGWLRYEDFHREASLPGEISKPFKGSLSRLLLDQLHGSPIGGAAEVAAGRILSGGPGLWPVDLLQIGLLQVWPTQRHFAGLRLQAAKAACADSCSFSKLASRSLGSRVLDEEARDGIRAWIDGWTRDWTCDLVRDLAHYWARYWAHDLTGASARDLAHYWVHDLVHYWAHDLTGASARDSARSWVRNLARFWARDWTHDWSRDLARDFLSKLGIDRNVSWGLDVAWSEIYSWGRASARFILSRQYEYTKGHPELGLLSTACLLSFHPGKESLEFDEALELYSPTLDPLWPALARHLARRSTPEDRALLIDLAQHPEKREPPLSWGLQFIVRGDVMLDDGSVVTLDELAEELGLTYLPYLEEVPD